MSIIVFNKKNYDVSKPGLYRFIDSDKFYKNVISLNTNSDPMFLVQALTSLTMHGNKHDNYVFGGDFSYVDKLLQSVPALSITCGANRNLIIYYLHSILGYDQVKTINSLTTYNRNNYDNGHSLFEMLDVKTKEWMLIDGDLNYRFKDSDDKWLSAKGFLQQVLSGKIPKFVKLSHKDYGVDPEFTAANSFNYTPLILAKFSSEKMVWQWYLRVFRSYSY